MISHRHRCIYVKVPKCGSTTVRDWFLEHGAGRHSFRPYWYGGLLTERLPSVTRLMNLHPDYATFAFVRDPYERFVSLYLHAVRHAGRLRADGWAGLGTYGTLAAYAELCRELLRDMGPLWGEDARAFFDVHGEREYGPARIPLKHLRFEIGHARPQTDFLPDCNPRRLFGVARVDASPLSFLGRVEAMDADFARLGERLDLPGAALPERNASGRETGAARAGRYRSYYDGAARRLVEDIYAADLEFTGCRFESARPAAPRARKDATCQPRPRPPRRRGRAARCLARLWHALWSSEVRLEQRIRACAPLRRLLRPLKALRGLPR